MDFAIWLTHSSIFSFLTAHRMTKRGTQSKVFSESTKAWYVFVHGIASNSLTTDGYKDDKVVNPYSVSLNETCYLIMMLSTCSRTFINCSCNFRPL